MFKKILIANRGEIACRVIKTAREMGVQTVAVYSDSDVNALHVELADEAVHIGGSATSESYLNIETIIAAAVATDADAIHPGYGFLSENPEFVEAVEAAEMVFIGPSAKAIRAMGLKDAAKVLMEQAGVPVVPGYHGVDQDDGLLASEAMKLGYPILIKAVAGGGGKGMRQVDAPDAFGDALQSARSEALAAFGNADVLVEKFVEKPRHIEIQVFGDGVDAVHLYERDCSLQRRHQKVIEEAPAPDMTDEMRAAMGQAAVQAAKTIGYSGAGTVEFIVDGSDGLLPDRFWFMEMNTRLQVEHPVTEMVTGVDLVEWQLRVAAGEALPKSQDQIELNGHSFEARLYAEDVPAGFLPATGTLTHLQFPPTCRADTGIRAGDTISPYYDPMIAKVIVHGATRKLALSQLQAALADTQVAGSVTNLSFLGKLARNREFVDGNVDTGLIARFQDELVSEDAATGLEKSLAVLVASGIDQDADWRCGFAIWGQGTQYVSLIVDGESVEAGLHVKSSNAAVIILPEGEFRLHRHSWGWAEDGAKSARSTAKYGNIVSVFGANTKHFEIVDPLDVENDATVSDDAVRAPMPGLVKAIYATDGDIVKAGDRLAVMEAMKMEHTLIAPRDGVILKMLVAAGDQVDAGAVLIQLLET